MEEERMWAGEGSSWRFEPERREAKAIVGIAAQGQLTERALGHEGRTCEVTAVLCHFIVQTVCLYETTVIGVTEFHGGWRSYGEARRFAASWGPVEISPGHRFAVVVECEPYWYVPSVGVVSAEA